MNMNTKATSERISCDQSLNRDGGAAALQQLGILHRTEQVSNGAAPYLDLASGVGHCELLSFRQQALSAKGRFD